MDSVVASGGGSSVAVRGLSCPKACEIFPDQGSNPCSLHWQVDSQPLTTGNSGGDIY